MKAEAPTRKMAERFLAALGAKGLPEVMQALTRIIGLPQKTIPFEAFAGLGEEVSYSIRMDSDLAAVELAAPSRNLSVFLFLPALVVFAHDWAGEPPEGRPAAGSIRPGFIIPPPTQAAQAIRRLALAQRLQEVQAGLGG
ncbi:hypothetical protein ruthe_01759, partial [Rubellimicrobium thermophilum DSM 16684]